MGKPSPAQTASSGSLVPLIQAIAAIFGALGVSSIITYFVIQAPQRQEAAFQAALSNLRSELAAQRPSVAVLRERASTAYQYARRTEWKCSVVQAMVDMTDPLLAQATPLAAYADYDKPHMPCRGNILLLAKYDWDDHFSTKVTNAATAERMRSVESVIAEGTTQASKGWLYIGRSQAGRFTWSSVVEPTPAVGGTVTISLDDGLPLQETPPRSAQERNVSSIVGFLPNGSSSMILQMRGVPEPLRRGEKPAFFVSAKVRVVKVSAASAIASNRKRIPLSDFLAAHILGALPADAAAIVCKHYKESNSLHSRSQRWVYAGEKADGPSDAFVSGTSTLDALCIPRDGAVVRLTRDVKVFVGADPHWPGVTAPGQIVAAGTQIQVVGDIAGYPFDATEDPNFCTRVPVPIPQKRYPHVPAGHAKHYCVYVPFNNV